jgi:hypothetical protein
MPFVPVDKTLQVETIFELDGQVVENTAYFKNTIEWDLAGVTAFIEGMKDLVVEELLPLLSSSITLVRLVGTLLDAVDALSYTLPVSPAVAGGVAQESESNNTAYTITFLTAGRGRSNRGRNYIAGIPVTDVTGNTVAGSFRTGLLAYYSALRAYAISWEGVAMVVVSRFSGVDAEGKPIPRAAGVTNAITGFTTYDLIVDSQRRRLPGRGQ